MAYGVVVPLAIAAKDVDSWNRSVSCASAVENGSVFGLLTKVNTTTYPGTDEVWEATVPTTGVSLTDVWMAYEPELVWTGSYRGLDPDPRNFLIPARKIFSAFKPQLHDLLLMSDDCFVVPWTAGNAYGNCTTADWQMVWGNTATSVSTLFTLKLLATSYISIGMGSIDNNRLTAYVMEVIGL